MDYYLYDYDESNSYEDIQDSGIVIEKIEEKFSEVLINCVYPSLNQISTYIGAFLLSNLVFRITIQICDKISKTSSVTETIKHFLSIICGCATLYYAIGNIIVYILILIVLSYVLICLLSKITWIRENNGYLGFTISLVIVIYFAVGEFFGANPKLWHQIRGIQMVAAMKILSIAFDTDLKRYNYFTNNDKNNCNHFKMFIMYLGYMLCPANCVLGPWVPFDEYLKIFSTFVMDISWLSWIVLYTFSSVIFLLMSNCLIAMLISDYSWKWFIAYRDALSFRCSHYFISFLSQAMMTTTGFTNVNGDEVSRNVGYQVTKPWSIEFPRSLVQVVINWNIPMHRWLKTYIFRVVKPYSTGLAIFITYLVSSLLHGLNFQLSAVLLSLGFYTYVEYSLRKKISMAFNACTLSNSCNGSNNFANAGELTNPQGQRRKRTCGHQYKWNSPLVLATNLIFSLLTVLHLVYLGVMFEAAANVQEEGFSFWHALAKWENLDFASHWTAICCFVFYLLI